MSFIKKSLFILIWIVLFTAGCGDSSGAGGELPEGRFPGQGAGRTEEDVSFLSQEFAFHMETYLISFKDFSVTPSGDSSGLLAGLEEYPANLIGQWEGRFTVSPEGAMVGSGELVTEAVIWAVDSNFCGYTLSEVATHTFAISGQVKEKGGKFYFPVKIYSVEETEKPPFTSPVEEYCMDPDDEPTPSLAMMAKTVAPIHRKALIGLTLEKLHNPLFGEEIEFGVTLNKKVDNVEFVIEILPVLVDLED